MYFLRQTLVGSAGVEVEGAELGSSGAKGWEAGDGSKGCGEGAGEDQAAYQKEGGLGRDGDVSVAGAALQVLLAGRRDVKRLELDEEGMADACFLLGVLLEGLRTRTHRHTAH